MKLMKSNSWLFDSR